MLKHREKHKSQQMLKAWLNSVISAVFGNWRDQPRFGCGRADSAERSTWHSAANQPHAAAAVDRRDRQTDARAARPLRSPASYTMRAAIPQHQYSRTFTVMIRAGTWRIKAGARAWYVRYSLQLTYVHVCDTRMLFYRPLNLCVVVNLYYSIASLY